MTKAKQGRHLGTHSTMDPFTLWVTPQSWTSPLAPPSTCKPLKPPSPQLLPPSLLATVYLRDMCCAVLCCAVLCCVHQTCWSLHALNLTVCARKPVPVEVASCTRLSPLPTTNCSVDNWHSFGLQQFKRINGKTAA